MIKVFVNGNQGTTGLKIFDRLEKRNDIQLLTIEESLRKDVRACAEVMNEADVAFLCLPDAAAIDAVNSVSSPTLKIIDTSTAHRTNEGWAYGFAELSEEHRKAIEESKRIAVPGCHASGFISLVFPLVKAGIIPKDYPVYCHSLTGYSGGGKKMIAQYQDVSKEDALFAPRQYGISQAHKHLKEMQAICSLSQAPIFCPIVDDYYCGMEVTVPLFTNLLSKKVTVSDINEILSNHYASSKLIKVVPPDEDGFMSANKFAEKDNMEISVCGNDERILLISRFDNLGKGASGAALQCFNIACGIEETSTLTL